MERKSGLHARWFRTATGLFFGFSGVFAAFALSFSGVSFWYVSCAVLWAASGFLWFFVPASAPGFTVIPVLGVGVMFLQFLPNFWKTDFIYRAVFLLAFVAIVLIFASFRRPETNELKPIAISLFMVLIAFSVDRLFTKKVTVAKLSMQWSADGTAPWGEVERNAEGETPVVLYRQGAGHGYCYDAVFSPELKSRLVAANKRAIDVEYNLFSDFGHKRSYNLHSVDGLVFNEGERPVRAGEAYGGQILDLVSMDCFR